MKIRAFVALSCVFAVSSVACTATSGDDTSAAPPLPDRSDPPASEDGAPPPQHLAVAIIESATRASAAERGGTPTRSTTYVKHGNNGTVSCDTYCQGAEWGAVGRCKSAFDSNVACDQATGLLTPGDELSCLCQPASPGAIAFYKHGNNGTVSCDTYCQGAEWGVLGTCVLGVAENIPCSQAIGLTTNASELTCVCE